MACRVDGPDSRHDLLACLDKTGPVSERYGDFHEQLAIEFTRLAHVAALPEIELRSAEHVPGIRKYRFAAFHQSADMIGMAVRDNHHVDILRLIAGLAQPLDQTPVWQPASKRLVLALQRAVAGVEQDELPSGIDQAGNERMLVAERVNPFRKSKTPP